MGKLKVNKKFLAAILAGTIVFTFVGCSANQTEPEANSTVIAESLDEMEDILFRREDGSLLTLLCIDKASLDETKFYAGYATYDKDGVYFEDAMSGMKFNLLDNSKFNGCEFYYTGFSSICKQEEVLDGIIDADSVKKKMKKLKLTNMGYPTYTNLAVKNDINAKLTELDTEFKIKSVEESECTYNLLDSSIVDKNKTNNIKNKDIELANQDDILLEKEDGSILQLLVTSNLDTDEDTFSCGYVTYSAFGVYFENVITGVTMQLNDDSRFKSCTFRSVPFCSVINNENAINGFVSKKLVEDTMHNMKLEWVDPSTYKVYNKGVNTFVSEIKVNELMEEAIDSPDKFDLTSKKRVGTRLTANSDEALFIREDGARLRLLYAYDLNEHKEFLTCGYITYDSNGMYFDDVITGEKTNLSNKEENNIMTEELLEKYCTEEDALKGKISKQSISEICFNISYENIPTGYILADYHVKYIDNKTVTYDLDGTKLLK